MTTLTSKHAWTLVGLLFVALYLLPLGLRPFSAPDGFRNAEIAREMIVSGDWVVPRLNGLVYFEKPALGYWLVAASMRLLGLHPFAARLPAALATALTAVLLGFLVHRFGADRRAAPLVAAAFLVSLLVYALGTAPVVDAPFSLFLSAGLAFSFVYLEVDNRRRGRFCFAAAGAALGLAFLTKGVLAPLLAGLVLLPYLLRTRSLGRFLRDLWIPALAAVVVALPWSLLAATRSDFWSHFFWVVNVQRFVNPSHYQHREPAWFYLPRIVAACLPAVVLLPAAWRGWRAPTADGGTRRLRLFAGLWLAMPLLFFSAASGKLITYLLVCIPPAVLLLVEPALVARRERGPRAIRWPLRANAMFAGLLVAAFAGLSSLSAEARALVALNPLGVWAIGVGVAFWLAAALASLRVPSGRLAMALLIVSPTALQVGAQVAMNESVMRTPSSEMVRRLEGIPPETILMADRDSAHALSWITRRSDVEIVLNPGELQFGLGEDPDRFLIADGDLAALLSGERSLSRTLQASRPVAMMLSLGRWEKFADRFPAPESRLRTDRFVLSLYAGRAVQER